MSNKKKRKASPSGKATGKKKLRPKVRFSFGVMITIFILTFLGCFTLYLVGANINPDFFKDDFVNERIDITTEDEEEEPSETTEEITTEVKPVVSNPVPKSPAVDVSYLDNCCIITDSLLGDMEMYGKFRDVIGSSELGAANASITKVESNYGIVTVYDTIKIKKPFNLYIMLGSDLGTAELNDMISGYTALVTNLHSSLPEMNIYMMMMPPVPFDTETVSNEKIDEYNTSLLDLAKKAGVYIIDTNSILKGENNSLDERFWSYDTSSMNSDAYDEICAYILDHTV